MMMTFWTSAPNQKVTGANTLPRIDVKENIALAINIALFSKGFRLVIPALSYKKEKLKNILVELFATCSGYSCGGDSYMKMTAIFVVALRVEIASFGRTLIYPAFRGYIFAV